jgi:hypothetical protein
VHPYAGYGYTGPGGEDLHAWIINSDGIWLRSYDYSDVMTGREKFFPILGEEAVAIGAGSTPWPSKYKATLDK